MKKIYYFVLLSLLVAACKQGKENAADNKILIDTAKFAPFFDKQLTMAVSDYYNAYQQATTDQAFEKAFQLSKNMRKLLTPRLGELMEPLLTDGSSSLPSQTLEQKIGFVNDYTPAMQICFVAEGTVPDQMYSIEELKKKTAQTKGDTDDRFVDILGDTYGDHAGLGIFFPEWYEQTWDYGGMSLLGEGKHKAVLQKLNDFSASNKAFADDITFIRTMLIEDITKGTIYKKTKEVILKEIDEILQSNMLTADEKTQIQARRAQFEDPEKHEIQVNCEKGDCMMG